MSEPRRWRQSCEETSASAARLGHGCWWLRGRCDESRRFWRPEPRLLEVPGRRWQGQDGWLSVSRKAEARGWTCLDLSLGNLQDGMQTP